jgi:hypothetical protein
VSVPMVYSSDETYDIGPYVLVESQSMNDQFEAGMPSLPLAVKEREHLYRREDWSATMTP